MRNSTITTLHMAGPMRAAVEHGSDERTARVVIGQLRTDTERFEVITTLGLFELVALRTVIEAAMNSLVTQARPSTPPWATR